MTTEDYILLAALYAGKGLDNVYVSHFNHLKDLGIVKHTEFGIKPINGEIIVVVKENRQTNFPYYPKFPLKLAYTKLR